MAKDAVFTVKLESGLRADFMAAAEAQHQPAAQILRGLMREFVQKQHSTEQYQDFLRLKVETARSQLQAGQFSPHDEVSSEFATKRGKLLSKVQRIAS